MAKHRRYYSGWDVPAVSTSARKRSPKHLPLFLDKVGFKYAILGKEEACTGDPARRAGNEFLFQMMAYQNIQVLNGYGIKKIVTTCPHCLIYSKMNIPNWVAL
jgi:heterodisulfide reductase subunit D